MDAVHRFTKAAFRRRPDRVLAGVLAIAGAGIAAPPGQAALAADAARPRAEAHRVNPHPPKIDGLVDDEVWRKAVPVTSFTQNEPDNGSPATESTEVRFVYDDDALYVAFIAHDSDPSGVAARLTRRDRESASDWFNLALDTRHDHQTGYEFAVNPLGVERDWAIYDDDTMDDSWNGVWDSAARLTADGWSAEMRIPFSQLRFSEADEQVWGLNVFRDIQRKNERLAWVHRARDASGYVSRFGELAGIRAIRPARHLELMPFVTARNTWRPDGDPAGEENSHEFRGGVDLKYGIGSGITLDATVNPDFGQVEADPSVLNLSEFETFFPEKRPFFVEGAGSFETPIQLFFSRRIGRPPRHHRIPGGEAELSRPAATTILGAGKLTGKTAGGTSFTVLEALTGEEHAVTDSAGVRRERLIEPRTNYVVSRLQRDVLEGNSSVGAIATAMHRDGAPPVVTGGVDWNFNLADNHYNLSGQVAGSHAGAPGDRSSGEAATLSVGKTAGRWTRWTVGGDWYSPDFRINDLGFLRRNDYRGAWGWFQLGTRRPIGIVRQSGHNLNYSWSENFDGLRIGNNGNYNNWFTFTNYWGAGFGVNYSWRRYSDTTTRGGAPVLIEPFSNAWIWMNTDSRKPVVYSQEVSAGKSSQPGIWWRDVNGSVKIRPSSALSVELGYDWSENRDFWQWVDRVVDPDGTVHEVFADLHTNVLDLSLRTEVTFSRNLSLQLWMQPFVAVGRYTAPVELVAAYGNELRPYDYPLSDFSSKALNSNVVLRWEYRSGSELYLVWSRNAYDHANPGDYDPARDLGDLFSAPGTDAVGVKLNLWMTP